MKTHKKYFANPSAIMALGLSLFAGTSSQVGATNPPYITYCSSITCKECIEDLGEFVNIVYPGLTSCPEVASFSWGMRLGGSANLVKPKLVDLSRIGAVEGVVRGKMRSYEDFYKMYSSVSGLNLQDVSFDIDVAKITAAVLDPSILKIHSDANFERIEDQGFINQVVTDNAFTHVDKLADGFRIRLWNKADITLAKSGKLYGVPTSVDPIQEIEFKSVPGVSDPGQFLLVSKERFGTAGVNTQTKHYHRDDVNDSLTEITYLGEGTSGTVLHKQELTYSDRGAKTWDYSIERKVYRASIDGAGQYGPLTKINHSKEVYVDYSTSEEGGSRGSRRMVSQIKDFGGENLTTTYTYYSTPENVYTHGRPKSVVNPDGSWRYYEYVDALGSPTSVTKEYYSWKDVSIANYTQAKLVETTLSADEMTRATSVDGVEVSKAKMTTATNAQGELLVTEQRWDGSGWATTVTCKYPETADPLVAGKAKWRENADGTAEHYAHTKDGDEIILTHSFGAGDRNGITAGSKTTTTLNKALQPIDEVVEDIESGLQLSRKSADLSYGIDSFGRAIKWVYNNNLDDYSIEQHGCCGLEFSRDRSGATVTYSRDAMKRVYRTVSKRSDSGTAITTTTAYDGLTRSVHKTDGTVSLLVSETTRTLSGLSFTTKSPDADGDGNPETSTRTIVHNTGTGSTTTNVAPDGATTITATFLDGKTKSVAGTAVTGSDSEAMTYDYGTHALNGGGLFTLVTQANGSQSTKAYRDQLGRNIRTENADGTYTRTTYYTQADPAGARGKLATVEDADETALAGSGSHVSYGYNARGERTSTITKLSNNQQMLTTTQHDDVDDADIGVSHRYQTWVNGVLTNTSLRSADGYKSKTITLAGTSTSLRSVAVDGAWTVTSTAANGAFSIQTYSDGLLKQSASYAAGADSSLPTSHLSLQTQTHDAFGRVLTSTDARTGTVTYNGYNENGSVQSVTDAGGRTTSYKYDVMGRTIEVDAPDTTVASPIDQSPVTNDNKTFTSYYKTGTVAGTWGDQTYARFNVYDDQNRLVELRTFQDLTHGTEPTAATTGFASTKWNYNPQRGWLDNKRYDDGKGTDYTYTAAGRLKTRTWSRGITTSYSYDQGQMVGTDYSDTTQDVVYAYDNFGRPTLVTQGSGVTQNQHTYLYDPATLVLDKETISYASGLSRTLDRSQDNLLRPSGFQLMNGTTEEHATSYGYDSAGRLAGVHTGATYPATPDFTYAYLANSGSLLETVTGPAHTVTNTYEATRNVLDTKSNSVGSVPSVVSQFDYSVNALGQRDNVSRSGSAFASANTETWKYNAIGEVVTADHSTNNAFDRAYQFDGIGNRKKSADSLTLPATDNYTANALNQLIAVGTTARVHDADGNLTDNGTHLYVWDAENRLIEIKKKSDNSTVATYEYDYSSRRISKTVGSNVTNFVYDSWNPIAKFSGTTLSKSYVWGMDLSGEMQGAGGVGGLLSVNDGSATYYPTYDGNGNVSEYVDSTGASVAHYEYDAFGQVVASGTKKEDFTHQFSTKQLDTESGLYYYGYRYYDSSNGRWLGRDPIEENGGYNVYGFLFNNVNRFIDFLGMQPTELEIINDRIAELEQRERELLQEIAQKELDAMGPILDEENCCYTYHTLRQIPSHEEAERMNNFVGTVNNVKSTLVGLAAGKVAGSGVGTVAGLATSQYFTITSWSYQKGDYLLATITMCKGDSAATIEITAWRDDTAPDNIQQIQTGIEGTSSNGSFLDAALFVKNCGCEQKDEYEWE